MPYKPPYEPTEEELEQRKAEIRATWTDAELRQRAGLEDKPWTPPAVRVCDLRSSFRSKST